MTAPPADGVRPRRRERTRRDILDAAWALAEQRGIVNLSLRDLAAEVGMRAPSLYTYFSNKAAIFDAMFAQGYRELDEMYADWPSRPADPSAALTEGAERFVRFCQASMPRYQLLFTRAVADWQPSPEAYAVSIASYERMTALLAAAGVKGQRRVDLWTAVTAGLAAQQMANEPTGDRWVRLSGDAAQMFLAHLGRMT